MPGGQLPEGLVTTNNETVGEEIANIDRIDLEDVARLWRDYSASRALLHDNTGERLANFFWRIWSNPAISNSIPGSTVARLFMTISQGGNRVRTTPVPSPRPTSPASQDTTPTPSSPHAVAESIPATDVADFPALTLSSPQAITGWSASRVADPPTPSKRPPSLSKGSPSLSKGSPSLSKRSPSLPKNAGSISDSISTSNKSPTSPSGTPSPTSSTSPMDRSLSNGSKKRAAMITASGARAKTRPSLPRRKSSQAPSSASVEPKRSPKSLTRKSPPRSPSLRQTQPGPSNVGDPRIAPPPGLPSIPSTTTSFALPSTSWQDISSPASSQINPPSAAATSQQPSSWLVDTNFRSKFVENQNRGASSTNLSGLGKSKSTVRFADQLPGQRSASGASDTQTLASVSKGAREAATLNAQARPRRGSGAIADDDDDDEQAVMSLPRTKSQLSMMIDHERRRSGTHELRPSPLQQEVRKGADDQPGSNAKDEEDEGDDDLLTMARKEGVTRAGTNDTKTRGKQKLSPKSRNKFQYQSPPTPPLY